MKTLPHWVALHRPDGFVPSPEDDADDDEQCSDHQTEGASDPDPDPQPDIWRGKKELKPCSYGDHSDTHGISMEQERAVCGSHDDS